MSRSFLVSFSFIIFLVVNHPHSHNRGDVKEDGDGCE